jgi:hypothetical protein
MKPGKPIKFLDPIACILKQGIYYNGSIEFYN